MNVWSVQEFYTFISFVNKEVYKNFFIMIYFTGMRLGEALALQWKDIVDGEVSISKSVTKKQYNGVFEVKEPKNISSIRKISLGSHLTQYFNEFKEKEASIPGFNEEWFVFGRLQPLSRTNISKMKDNAIAKGNLRRIRLHDFRHSHASNLIADGVNIVAVSRRLGHSDVEMTLKVYTHLIDKTELDLIQKIENSSQYLLKTKEKPD